MPTVSAIPPPVTPQPAAAPVSPPASSSAPAEPFRTVLARTTAARNSDITTPADRAVVDRAVGDRGVGTDADATEAINAADATDETATDSTQLAAQLAAGLFVVGPGVVLSSSGSPVPRVADPGVPGVPDPTTTTADTLSRAEQLRLRLAAAPQTLPQSATAATTTATLNQPLTAARPRATAADATDPTNTDPTAAANPNAVAAAVVTPLPATGLPGGLRPTVVAQAPVVADLTPPAPTPPAPAEAGPSPIAGPTEASAVPGVQIGDRPSVAGERFAALAAAARSTERATQLSTAPVAVPPEAAPILPVQTAVPKPAAAANPLLAATVGTATPPTATPPTATPPAVVPAPVPLPDGRPLPGNGTTPRVAPFAAADVVATPAAPGRAFADVFRDWNADATTSRAADPTAAGTGSPLPVPTAAAPASTPAASPTATATPAVAVQVADGIVAHARVLDRDGATEFRLRLDPPELGRVHVRLVTDADGLRGQVVVADDAVRRMIESQLPELRQRLEAAGVTVQRLDVSTDPGTGGPGNPYRGSSTPEFAPLSRTADPRRPAGRAAVAGRVDVTV